MNHKTQIITMLEEEFNLWEELLTGMNEELITAPRFPSNLSIKDIIAHHIDHLEPTLKSLGSG